MGKLRSKEQKNKLDGKANHSSGCCSDQYPWCSFRYLTTNPRYNLEKLDTHLKAQTLNTLYSKLVELTNNPWQYWMQKPKAVGLETMEYGDIQFKANMGSEGDLAKDTSIYIFRFDTYQGFRKGRILGFKKSPCAAFHIIGYDVDFSAYDHGN